MWVHFFFVLRFFSQIILTYFFWGKILALVIARRQKLIDEVDVKPVDDDAVEDLAQDDEPKAGPSTEAMSKLTDYSKIPISNIHF